MFTHPNTVVIIAETRHRENLRYVERQRRAQAAMPVPPGRSILSTIVDRVQDSLNRASARHRTVKIPAPAALMPVARGE
jgi:hypothetical protein